MWSIFIHLRVIYTKCGWFHYIWGEFYATLEVHTFEGPTSPESTLILRWKTEENLPLFLQFWFFVESAPIFSLNKWWNTRTLSLPIWVEFTNLGRKKSSHTPLAAGLLSFSKRSWCWNQCFISTHFQRLILPTNFKRQWKLCWNVRCWGNYYVSNHLIRAIISSIFQRQ